MTDPARDWTARLLAYHVERLIAETDRRLNEKADLLVLRSIQRADAIAAEVSRVEMTMNQRFDAINEFRAAMTDQQRNYVPRTEVEAQWRRQSERLDGMALEHQVFVRRPEHDQLVDRITALETRVTRDEGEDRGIGQRTSSLRQNAIIAVAIGGLLITILVTLVDHFIK